MSDDASMTTNRAGTTTNAAGNTNAAGHGPVSGKQSVGAGRRSPALIRWFIGISAVLAGVVQALIWLAVAPGRQFKVRDDGAYVTLPTADYHSFDALALFLLSGAALGLILAVAVWQVRAIRGVATLVTVVGAAAVGAVVAFGVAWLFAGGTDPASVGATGTAMVVVQGPRLGTWLAVLAEPLAAAVAYTFLVAWDGRRNLGRGH